MLKNYVATNYHFLIFQHQRRKVSHLFAYYGDIFLICIFDYGSSFPSSFSCILHFKEKPAIIHVLLHKICVGSVFVA